MRLALPWYTLSWANLVPASIYLSVLVQLLTFKTMLGSLPAIGVLAIVFTRWGTQPGLSTILTRRLQAIKQLIECGAHWDIVDNEGRTPLHWTCTTATTKSMEALLKRTGAVLLGG